MPAHMEVFFARGPSMGGARPKAVVTVDGGEWIAKFPARNDTFNVPIVERATLKPAREAGLVGESTVRTRDDGDGLMVQIRFSGQQSEMIYRP